MEKFLSEISWKLFIVLSSGYPMIIHRLCVDECADVVELLLECRVCFNFFFYLFT